MILGKLDLDMEKHEQFPYLTPYKNINSEWIEYKSMT